MLEMTRAAVYTFCAAHTEPLLGWSMQELLHSEHPAVTALLTVTQTKPQGPFSRSNERASPKYEVLLKEEHQR
jgi:hypothetical protein